VSSFRLPLVASILGHAGALALLALFAAQLPPVPLPEPRKSGIEVMLAPPQPAAETPPPTPEPPPVAETEPPPPEPPPVVISKPEPPPPPPKPAVHKPVVKPPPPRPQPVRETPQQLPLPLPRAMPQPAQMQTAAIPVPAAPHPAPLVSGNYRASLSAWLESHKRYPDGARSRGEEGRAVLRFRVERSGRVLNYAVVSSTGYPDLDAAIDAMMRGATLPSFPADMTASDVEVSVTVRFALTH
jgi:protein TonB